jgi:hypothetical protein
MLKGKVTQRRIGNISQVHKKPESHMPTMVVPMVLTQRTGREITNNLFSTFLD